MFIDITSNVKVIEAVKIANKLITSDEFIETIKNVELFYMATCNGDFIARMIADFANNKHGKILVYCYKPRWRFTSALGYFSPSKPNNVNLNYYKLNRSTGSIVATLIHEMIHFLDNKSTESFGHGGDDPSGKENTAPFWIDNLAESIVNDDTMFLTSKNGNIAYELKDKNYAKV